MVKTWERLLLKCVHRCVPPRRAASQRSGYHLCGVTAAVEAVGWSQSVAWRRPHGFRKATYGTTAADEGKTIEERERWQV